MKILRVAWVRQQGYSRMWIIEPSMPWAKQDRYYLAGNPRYGIADDVLSPSARTYIFEGRWPKDPDHDNR